MPDMLKKHSYLGRMIFLGSLHVSVLIDGLGVIKHNRNQIMKFKILGVLIAATGFFLIAKYNWGH